MTNQEKAQLEQIKVQTVKFLISRGYDDSEAEQIFDEILANANEFYSDFGSVKASLADALQSRLIADGRSKLTQEQIEKRANPRVVRMGEPR